MLYQQQVDILAKCWRRMGNALYKFIVHEYMCLVEHTITLLTINMCVRCVACTSIVYYGAKHTVIYTHDGPAPMFRDVCFYIA